MKTTCGDVTTEVSCNSGETNVAFENKANTVQEAFTEVKPEGQVLDPDGNVIYTNVTAEPKKIKHRIPA